MYLPVIHMVDYYNYVTTPIVEYIPSMVSNARLLPDWSSYIVYPHPLSKKEPSDAIPF